MNSDIIYIARIKRNKKELAIDQLKSFCINTDDFKFNLGLINNDCMISFVIKDEESTKWFKDQYEFSNAIAGKTLIGNIQLWIKDDEGFCDFEFWAVSGLVGQVCLDSIELRRQLVGFVKKLEGHSLKIDYSDGYMETIFENK